MMMMGSIGGSEPGEMFVIAGDQNSDPLDGDSIPGSIQQLIDHPLVNAKVTPESAGQSRPPVRRVGLTTRMKAILALTPPISPTLRREICAPTMCCRSRALRIVDGAVFWPLASDPLFRLTGTFPFPSSDHRLVWIDVSHGKFQAMDR